MLRRTISLLLLIMFVCSNMSFAVANSISEMALLDKLVIVEKFTVGNEQTGAMIERINKVEKELWGRHNAGSLVSRVDQLYSYCQVNTESAPSFLIKLNAVEWSLTHAVTTLPVKARIENLERLLLSNATTGSLEERLNELMKYAYSNGKIVVGNVKLNKDSLVKIKITSPLSTRTNRAGDVVAFQVAEDIHVDGTLVIAKGAQGIGRVNKVEQARNFGRDAQLQISFDAIDGIDGSSIPTLLGEKAKEQNKSLAMAAGASVAGMMILGPIGIVGGAFVHGKDIEIPADSELYIQVKEQTNLYGI